MTREAVHQLTAKGREALAQQQRGEDSPVVQAEAATERAVTRSVDEVAGRVRAVGRSSNTAASGKAARKAAAKQVKERMVRQGQSKLIRQARQTAKAAAELTQKAAVAISRATSALFGTIAGVVGGGVLVVALCIILLAAAVVGSPFGIFFADNSKASTVTVAQAAVQINSNYADALAYEAAGFYDNVYVYGSPPSWPDVLAVFAARYAASSTGTDVATLDADRVNKLSATFWDMTRITSWEDEIEHPDTDPEDEVDDSWTEHNLVIFVSHKTPRQMAASYHFTDYQKQAMEELLSDRAALSALAGV